MGDHSNKKLRSWNSILQYFFSEVCSLFITSAVCLLYITCLQSTHIYSVLCRALFCSLFITTLSCVHCYSVRIFFRVNRIILQCVQNYSVVYRSILLRAQAFSEIIETRFIWMFLSLIYQTDLIMYSRTFSANLSSISFSL